MYIARDYAHRNHGRVSIKLMVRRFGIEAAREALQIFHHA